MFEPLNEIKREIGTEISQPHDDSALLCHLKRKVRREALFFCAGRAAGDFDVLRAGGPTWTARQRPDGEGRRQRRGGVGNDDNGEPGGPHVGLLPGAGDVDDGVGAVAGRGGGRPVGAVRLRRQGGGVGLGGAGNARRRWRRRRRRLRPRAWELPIFRVRRVGSELGHPEPERQRDHGGTPLPLPGVVQRGRGAAAAVPRGAAAAVGQVGGRDPGPAQGGARLARHLRDGRGRGARLRRRRAALPRQPRQAQLPRGRAPAPGHRRPRRRAGPGADRRGVGLDARHVRRRRAGLGLPALPDAPAGQGCRRQPGQPSLVLRRGRRRCHVQLVWRRRRRCHEQLLWRRRQRRHHERFPRLLLLVPVILRLGGHRPVLLVRLLCSGPLLHIAARLAAPAAAERRGGGVELGERAGALRGDDDGGLVVRLKPAAVPPATHPIGNSAITKPEPTKILRRLWKNKVCTDGVATEMAQRQQAEDRE